MNRQLAENLDDASILLDGQRPLDPRDAEIFNRYYVDRGLKHGDILRQSKAAIRLNHEMNWFFTGHTGSGKSTELNRILDKDEIKENYLPILVDMLKDFDTANIEFPDIIVGMAKQIVAAAENAGHNIDWELEAHVENWGKDVQLETGKYFHSEGKAGLGIKAFFGSLAEEIKTGGSRKQTIRTKLYQDITQFIHLLDNMVESLSEKTGRQVLCVIDGLDHVSDKNCYELFSNHFNSLTKPKVSKIFLIPLYLMNTDFRVRIEGNCSLLPNLKVFQSPQSRELDEQGLSFYRELISRYVALDKFTPEALKSLFELSSGVVRDMIRLTGDACGFAADAEAAVVEIEHVEKVWNQTMRFFRSILFKSDYEILKNVHQDPYPEGLDGVPDLLYRKAIIFYPNGEGWYGVHPAVGRILEKA